MISLIPMRPGYEANHDIMKTVDNITEQNWRGWKGWYIAHRFLVGVDEDNVLLEVSGRQSHRTHHHCQLRSHMMSHDMQPLSTENHMMSHDMTATVN